MTGPTAGEQAHHFASHGVPAFPIVISWVDRTQPTPEELVAPALEYRRRDWPPVPLRDTPDGKQPTSGVTGYEGRDLSPDEIRREFSQPGISGVGVRMPEGVIGIDVDCHDDKDGAATIRKVADTLGAELPPTATTAGRAAELGAGIRFYRIPEGVVFSQAPLNAAGGGVDLIQRHHRFAKVWPSVHHVTGQPYGRCDVEPGVIVTHDDGGEPLLLPYVDELADLPPEWVTTLATTVAEAREAITWDNPLHDAPEIGPRVEGVIGRHWINRTAGASRYDSMRDAVIGLVRLDSEGHSGVGTALGWLRGEYLRAVADTRAHAAESEFDRAHAGALVKVANTKRPGISDQDVRDILGGEAPGTTASPLPPGPSRFFDRDGIQATTLARHVLDQGPIRPGADGRSWAWVDGYWQPTGDTEALRRVREALGERFRPTHANTVAQWLRAEPQLDPNRPDFATINNRSGLLDWRTGELRPHTPEHPSTVCLPIDWSPGGACPRIDAFLAEVLEPDSIEFFHEVVGYLLAAGNPLHLALLFLGSGRNGKGTALRLIEQLLGSGNVAHVTPHQLADNRFAAATLYGKLANLAGDLEARLIERTDTFKMLTGGDSISAEHKYGQAFTFRCWATFAFSANEAPAVQDHSEGFYSRWLVVPFPRTIPESSRLPEHQLDAELHRPAELQGLFVKAVAGLQRLMDRGRFDPPPSVLAATGQFRRDTDPIAQFLDEETTSDPDGWVDEGWVTRSRLLARYRAWCDEAGRKPVAATKLYNRLTALPAVTASTRRGDRGFRGVELRQLGLIVGGAAAPAQVAAPPAPRRESATREDAPGGAGGAAESPSYHISPERTGERVERAAPPAPPAPLAGASAHGWRSRSGR